MRDDGWTRHYQEFAQGLIDQGAIPGVAVALARDGAVVYEHGFGHRDAHGRLPVTPTTRFGLGSVTKSFPCLAIMQLHEAGRLSIHDPVARWLPAFRLPRPDDADRSARVTIHHLMTHAGGLPPEPALLHARAASICADPDLDRMHPIPMGVTPDIRTWERIDSYDDLLALMARQEFRTLGEPGSIISYSNEGYVLLAAIVERASGQSFAQYLQANVLDPLGLGRTGLYTRSTRPQEPEVVPFAVDARGGKRVVFPSPAWWDQGSMYGNGGLKSTTEDLLRYLEVYRTGGVSNGTRVLSEASVAEMTAPHQPIPTGGAYGYGLRIVEAPGIGRVVEHGGGNKGVATQVMVAPERGLTAVALTNLANAPALKLAAGLLNAAVGLDPAAPWRTYPEYAVDRRTLWPYVGTYDGQPGVQIRVAERGGQLLVAMADALVPARPYDRDCFLLPETEETVRFLRRENGEVWAMFSGLRTYPRSQ